VLRKLCPERVKVLDTGCCGMAGSFGYTTERYDLSMKIGELGVLPAARSAAAKGAVVLAPGTSCRHQIHDGAHVRAQHPMEFLASRLREHPQG
jgi:Fe-S oxidoreductase